MKNERIPDVISGEELSIIESMHMLKAYPKECP
jgi:hypothetical protein